VAVRAQAGEETHRKQAQANEGRAIQERQRAELAREETRRRAYATTVKENGTRKETSFEALSGTEIMDVEQNGWQICPQTQVRSSQMEEFTFANLGSKK